MQPGFSRAVGWIWFGACAVVAAACLAVNGFYAALLFLVSGAAACPLLWHRVAARDVVIERKYRWLVGTFALVAGLLVKGPHQRPVKLIERAKPSAVRPTQTALIPPVFDVERGPSKRAAQGRDAKASKIAGLLADLKALPERDYETRLTFWNQVAALEPSNAAYAREKQRSADKVAALAELKSNPERGMVVERISPRKMGFGNVLIVDITLRNDSLSNLKDFRITCTAKGHSGSIIGRNTRVLYEMVEARGMRTFRKFNMGFVDHQAATTACHVEDAAIG